MHDEQSMRAAIAAAREGIQKGESPFGACIVREGEIIACSHNTVWSTCDITAHAEVTAIRAACSKLGTIDLCGSVIYSTCEPCPMCFAACHWAKISRVVFGTRIGDAQMCGFSELTLSNEQMKSIGGSPMEVLPGFLRSECLEVFQEWSSRPDRRIY